MGICIGNRSNRKPSSWNGSEGKIKKDLLGFCWKLVWAVTFIDMEKGASLGQAGPPVWDVLSQPVRVTGQPEKEAYNLGVLSVNINLGLIRGYLKT